MNGFPPAYDKEHAYGISFLLMMIDSTPFAPLEEEAVRVEPLAPSLIPAVRWSRLLTR